MTNPTISVIIPIYNSEKYLFECINSLIQQSFKDFEIILINDGSTDSSEEICKIFVNKFNNIKYYYQSNLGVSAARNYGIKKSLSEYIIFIDSDDWVNDRFLEKLLNELVNNEVDLVNQIYFKQDEFGKWKKEGLQFSEKILHSQIPKWIENLLSFHTGPFPKIFKKDIILNNNILFKTNINFSEDLIFLLEYMEYAEKGVFFSNSCGYNYRYVSTSLGNKYKNSPLKLIYDPLSEILRILNNSFYSHLLDELSQLPKLKGKVVSIFMFMYANLYHSSFSERFNSIRTLKNLNISLFINKIVSKNIFRKLFYHLINRNFLTSALIIDQVRFIISKKIFNK